MVEDVVPAPFSAVAGCTDTVMTGSGFPGGRASAAALFAASTMDRADAQVSALERLPAPPPRSERESGGKGFVDFSFDLEEFSGIFAVSRAGDG